METSFKNWLCPNFLSLPKKSELPKLWGGCSPPRPPGPYAYGYVNFTKFIFSGCNYTEVLFLRRPRKFNQVQISNPQSKKKQNICNGDS